MKKILVTIVTLVILSSLAQAQGLGLNGIGAGAGYTTVSFNNSGVSETLPGFAVSAFANFGENMNGFSLYPEIQYFKTSKNFSNAAINSTATWKLSDFAINLNVHYSIPAGETVSTYIGAGIGYNMLSSDVTVSGLLSGSNSTTDSRFGINILGGANINVGKVMALFVEPRYVIASDINHFIIKAGVTFALK
jgi:opacity protein-like surface antigen